MELFSYLLGKNSSSPTPTPPTPPDYSSIGRPAITNAPISQYWPSAVNKLYIYSIPVSTVSFTDFTGEEIIFDEDFADTATYAAFDFKNCANLKRVVNLSIKNSISTITFAEMFKNCSNLEEVTFGEVNIANLSNMGGICGNSNTKLKEFDASGWNATTVSAGVDLGWSFYVASAIKKVDLSGITGKISTLRQAFQECRELEEINLANFTNITQYNGYAAFYFCTSLKKLDIRNLALHELTDYTAMFGYGADTGLPADCLIIVKDATEKAWINTNFAWLTNVQTVSEYENN